MIIPQHFIDKLSDHLRRRNKLEEIIQEFQVNYNLLPCIGVEIEFYLSENINIEQFESLLEMKLKKEKGNNQYEIDLSPSTNIINYIEEINSTKKKIENIAKKLDGSADLRAKPFINDYGNAMHFHINFVEMINTNEELVKEMHCSSPMRSFPRRRESRSSICYPELDSESYKVPDQSRYDNGILLDSRLRGNDLVENNKEVFINNSIFTLDKIAQSVCYYILPTFLIFNTYENDYLRFDKNFMAPTNVSFGNNNRSVAVRIPALLPKRVEYRIANPHTNIYIALFTILNSVLLGLKYPNQANNINKIYGNAYDEQYNLPPLPKSIEEALKLFSLEFFIGTRQEGVASIESFLEIMKELEC